MRYKVVNTFDNPAPGLQDWSSRASYVQDIFIGLVIMSRLLTGQVHTTDCNKLFKYRTGWKAMVVT